MGNEVFDAVRTVMAAREYDQREISFGYPKRRVIGKKKREPFNQVVSAERFGEPLR